jgi:hypothetical protein
MTDTKEFIWTAVREMLDGHLANDRPRIDRYIHKDATMWDSEERDLVYGLAGLNEVRARRPTKNDEQKVQRIESLEPVIDVYDDFAICRHILKIYVSDGSLIEEVRNTGVWRKFPDGWFLIHNHEDKL